MTTQNQLKFVNNVPEGIKKAYVQGATQLSIPPSHLLAPHWHPNANEITTCKSGEGTVTIIAPNQGTGNASGGIYNTYAFKAGDTVFLPQGFLHYFVNTGEENFTIDLSFDKDDFNILTLNEIVTLLPSDIKITPISENKDYPFLAYDKQVVPV